MKTRIYPVLMLCLLTLWVAAAPGTGFPCKGETPFLDQFDIVFGEVKEVLYPDDDGCRGVVAVEGWIGLVFSRPWAQLDYEIELSLDELTIEEGQEIQVFELSREANDGSVLRLVTLIVRQDLLGPRTLLVQWTDENLSGGQSSVAVLPSGDHRVGISWMQKQGIALGQVEVSFDGSSVLNLAGLELSAASRPNKARVGLLAGGEWTAGELLFRPLSYTWHVARTDGHSPTDSR